MLPEAIKTSIEHGLDAQIINQVAITGGDINYSARLDIDSGERFFVKWNLRTPENMFQTEAQGLNLLSSAESGLVIPEVRLVGDNFLLMEFIEESSYGNAYLFGSQLAKLHRKSNELFGLETSNYIGRLPQSNRYHADWLEFFMRERIEPQVKMAIDSGKLPNNFHSIFERAFNYTYVIFPEEPPALLHGDLWNGNYMWTSGGDTAIYDPAVYFGHREMDLAMTRLFGGFSEEFYHSYNDIYPLEKGYEERFKLCNLYPILVHANLFGGGYVSQAKQLLKRFFG
ncbi:MAG: fructosamine kinase family protein [Balneolaceae bacterium]|nr:fructosamine kinase family protein [Balneolaceae bacterium]